MRSSILFFLLLITYVGTTQIYDMLLGEDQERDKHVFPAYNKTFLRFKHKSSCVKLQTFDLRTIHNLGSCRHEWFAFSDNIFAPRIIPKGFHQNIFFVTIIDKGGCLFGVSIDKNAFYNECSHLQGKAIVANWNDRTVARLRSYIGVYKENKSHLDVDQVCSLSHLQSKVFRTLHRNLFNVS